MLPVLRFLTREDSSCGGKPPHLYFQLFQRLVSRNKQRFLSPDFPVPGAPPDALLLVSDVALVRDLLALRATVGLKTRGEKKKQTIIRSPSLGFVANTASSYPGLRFGRVSVLV